MGTRALQLLMIVLLTGCVAWASAIFFGPWALTKYLEGQAGDAVEVSGLKITSKLAVTASRVQMSDGGAVTASLRGVEVDWRFLTGDEPAVLISVASGVLAGSLSVEGLQVTLTQADDGEPLQISGTAARVWDPNSVSVSDVNFEALTDYSFQFLRRVMATTGGLNLQHPTNATASTSHIEVDKVDLGVDLLWQDLSGMLALTNLDAGGTDLSMTEADIKFDLADGLVSLSFSARDLFAERASLEVSGLTGILEFDAARSQPAGPIQLVLNDFVWKDIRFPSSAAKVTLGDKQVKVTAEGMSQGSEITLGRRYIGRAPDASFGVEFDASAMEGNLQINGDVKIAAIQQPVDFELRFKGVVADVAYFAACAEVVCEVSDVIYVYNLSVAGETLSGTSRCRELTCLSGGRTHDLSTTHTDKFFANMQRENLISPLVLGGAYAQMLQGVTVGTGHKINF